MAKIVCPEHGVFKNDGANDITGMYLFGIDEAECPVCNKMLKIIPEGTHEEEEWKNVPPFAIGFDNE